ncbi:MAG: H+transporting two-sector ATPase subunit [Sedimentibacter sp.]|jgi:V/A-type H+-transporting ATPase subunit C|nr:H+transporting two-sector ATPase subunit [Sedimentibacter sp.]
MNPNMAYYALATKIATKKGRLLNKDDWNKYLDCNTVEQLTNLLKSNTEYGKAFKEVLNVNLDREDLETVLLQFKTLEIENLLHYFSGPYKEFIKTVLMEAEIKDLSLILRKIARKESLEGIGNRFIHSKIYSNLNFESILSSSSVEQVISKLKGTTYFSGLSNLSNEDAVKREFHIEMKMYMALYKDLLEKAEKLKKEDQKGVREIVGLKIDLLNIQWIYRAKKYYEISPEEIFIYSLTGGTTLGYNRLKKLCFATLDEFIQLIKDFLRKDILKDLNDADINVVIDTYMLNYISKNSYNNIGTALSFIYMLDIIINDLTSITEGILYKVPKEKLKGYLAYKI